MEQNVAKLNPIEMAWAWFEANKKQVLLATVIVVVVGAIVSFYIWHKGEKETVAAEDFSKAIAASGASGSAATTEFLKVASEHPGTGGGARALLQAGALLFTQGKYPEAQTQFERFLREYTDSPLRGQALLGVATCLDAQGKMDEAARAYKNVSDARPNENVAVQAKFELARIYESQNKIAEALSLYEEVVKTGAAGSIGDEAAVRADELKRKFPAPTPASMTGTVVTPAAPKISLATTNLPP